jgi:uncharacterized protein
VKILLDSNVLVSAFATRGLCADVLRVVLAEHELVTADAVIEEVSRALTRKLRVPGEVVDAVREFLGRYSTTARPGRRPSVKVRDPDDAVVLATAIAAGADVLVTGDRDLLDVRDRVDEIRIVDPRGFQALVIRRDRPRTDG